MAGANGKVGEFVYFGIADALRKCINIDLHDGNVIYIKINNDGMSLKKSGVLDMWSILGQVHFDPNIYEVFPIAIYCGKGKPNLELFLESFINEVNTLQIDGIMIENRFFDVRLKCFTCDTPARAFLKCTQGHGGTYACERCEVIGVTEQKPTVYPSQVATERTDESFINRRQPEYHHGLSPVERIFPYINMILFFVLDFMHLCCLGIMKKLLEYWLIGELNIRLGTREREELSRRMNVFYSQIPSGFQRKSRSTKHVAKWKTVKFRFFLLYCGVIELKGILGVNVYNHFVLFHAACRILCCDTLCRTYAHRAKEYLRSFFTNLNNFYGIKSKVINAHNLIHLADDVIYMGCSLTHITDFPFENYLGKLKNLIRTAHRPLAQLCRRLSEQDFFFRKTTLPPLFQILKQRRNSIVAIKYKQFKITCSSPDNAILLDDNSILTINRIFESPEGMKV